MKGSTARASGVEEHVSSAHVRPGHGTAKAAAGAEEKGKKREYTVKQMEVVKRVKSCKAHEYYQILASELKQREDRSGRGTDVLVERKCSENDVKKAYKKVSESAPAVLSDDGSWVSLH
jgi:DnaJ family protein B protein 12